MDRPNRWWLTPCGLDCSSCSIHLRTEEELDYWRGQNVDLEKIRCDGCRSDRKGDHWSPQCKILICCVDEKGLEFCSQCDEFPCHILEEWIGGMDHHAKAVEKLKEMKEMGTEEWLAKNGYH
jgi:hypothetical protein